ncbi:MAG: hypothetical protein CFE27_12795 [Alphaproteobacteria bacterium PA1]|nr:MAG: hypothetical protein CFE27_12795 [Alphaproteobacteria bacterium PA1]
MAIDGARAMRCAYHRVKLRILRFTPALTQLRLYRRVPAGAAAASPFTGYRRMRRCPPKPVNGNARQELRIGTR